MRSKLLGLGGIGLVALGCASPGGRPPAADEGPDYRVEMPGGQRGRVPTWAGRPLSWDKLRTLAEWLQQRGVGFDPYWVVEGHLQLAEGRLHYARLDPAEAATRRVSASAGFRRVLAHPVATPSQRQRAQLGLDNLDTRATSGARIGSLPGVLPRSAWGARAPVPQRMDPAGAAWNWLTVHHSAEREPAPLDGSLRATAAALRDIQSAHMNGEGYGDIGYHFLIDPAGRVLQGRDLRWQGAHSYGTNNIGNVGICLLGNFEHERPTPDALRAMHGLIEVLRQRLDVLARNVRGHDDWRSTACPGRYLKPHLARYR